MDGGEVQQQLGLVADTEMACQVLEGNFGHYKAALRVRWLAKIHAMQTQVAF